MARQEIPLGTAPTGEGGDNARQAFGRINQMTAELYAANQAQQEQLVQLFQADANLGQEVDELRGVVEGKVDKRPGYDLSQENFTPAEKLKLAGLESSHFKGLFSSLAELQQAIPTGSPGDYADVDAGPGLDVQRYVWDHSDSAWIIQASGSTVMTPAQVKTAYESNPDTNPFNDAAKDKLAGIAPGATANSSDVYLRDRSNHTGSQLAATISDLASAIRGTLLTGLSLASSAAVTASDSILSAIGRLQAQITGHVGAGGTAHATATTNTAGFMSSADKAALDALGPAVAGKQDALISGTNLRTVNGQSLLGAGDVVVGDAAGSWPTIADDNKVGGYYGSDGTSVWGAPVSATFTQEGPRLVLRKTVAAGAPAYVETAINLGTAGDYIIDIAMQGSIGSGDGQYLWLGDASGTTTILVYLNYDRMNSVQRLGCLSCAYVYSPTNQVVPSTFAEGVDTSGTLQQIRLHIDRKNNNIDLYYSNNYGVWVMGSRLPQAVSVPLTVLRLGHIAGASNGSTLRLEAAAIYRPNVVVFGDSIASSMWHLNARLYSDLRNSLPIEKGQGGETSAQTLARVSQVTSTGCRVVLLHASSNDYPSVSASQRTTNIANTVAALKAAGCKVILLNALYGSPVQADQPGRVNYYRSWWDSSAATVGADLLIDINQPLMQFGANAQYLSSDNLHPTERGYKAIAMYVQGFNNKRATDAITGALQDYGGWQYSTVIGFVGPSYDFTGIPIWATEVEIMFDSIEVATTAGVPYIVPLTSSGPVTTGYGGGCWTITASAASGASAATGFVMGSAALPVGSPISGVLRISRMGGDPTPAAVWFGIGEYAMGTQSMRGIARLQLYNALIGLRLAATNGATFRGGACVIRYRR
ncbi:hypothetical protein A7D27_11545 [Pseudomonas sp. 1D4]|uniref:SGNH/GDSL hydrolase family protein n=1 Tax=Pseudomonadaceae TaxID=135621 RepID=UPI00084AFD8B|nr:MULTISPECIES: SGNH/GDSL hydrolase family protein [Pseudomonas]OEC42506.1 hypothetical protein A7D27_11545 [Pseudomonas sp. 1D4]